MYSLTEDRSELSYLLSIEDAKGRIVSRVEIYEDRLDVDSDKFCRIIKNSLNMGLAALLAGEKEDD